MRFLFWFLLLALCAVGIALGAKLNSGYALLVSPPYRIELSLNLLLLLLIGGFVLAYLASRLVSGAVRMPRRVRAFRRQQKLDRARSRQDSAVLSLLEGRFGKAQQHASDALAIPQSSGINAILAARAALEMREFDAAEQFLARADAQVPSLAVSRLMLSAEVALEQGHPRETLRRLADLKKEAGMHTAALKLELRALQAAGRWSEIPPLLDQLVKRKVFDGAQAEQVRIAAQTEHLKSLSHDSAGLRDYWNRLPENVQRHPKVARAAAASFLMLGGDRDAAEISARALEREWSPELVEIFGDCVLSDPTRQLEQAERWLTTQNQDPVLLRVLGELCQKQQLWGKARTYLEASVALGGGWRAHLALGELLGQLGRAEEANTHFVAALKLATGELDRERALVPVGG